VLEAVLIFFCSLQSVIRQFADKPTYDLSSHRLVNSQTSQPTEISAGRFGVQNQTIISDRLHYSYNDNN